VDVDTAWQLDTFGHHAQTPQMLRLAGYTSFWFFRGVPSPDTPSEFVWEGIDGTRIPAHWLPHGYAMAYGSPDTPSGFYSFMQDRYTSLDPYSSSAVRPGPAGADVSEPEEHVPRLLTGSSAPPDGVEVRMATPTEFEAAAPRAEDLPIVRGELNPIFQGTYSSRIELKQMNRHTETVLTDAERVGAIASFLGMDGHADSLWSAWEPVLFNQAHDLMSGVMTDHVYADVLAGYEHARRLAEDALESRLRAYAECVDTQGDGAPILVLNTLPWDRTELVSVNLGFSGASVGGVRIVGPAGEDLPVQLYDAIRNSDGTLLAVRAAFIARDVPAMGHSVCHAVATEEDIAISEEAETQTPFVLETDRLRVGFDRSGAITSLMLRKDGTELLCGQANVIAQERDEGDLWELYHPLDGGSRIAMKEPHPVSPSAILSTATPPESLTVLAGPVFSEIRLAGAIGEGRFATVARVTEGTDRVDIRTTLVNRERFVRDRLQVPTALGNGERFDEIPFGAVQRPAGVEYPAQNWMDWTSGNRGLAMLNRGIPGSNVVDGCMLLSLARATRIVAYGYGGGYEPGMTSDTGFELGRELTFAYALVPHEGDWRKGRIPRHGQEFQHPLIVRKCEPHAGRLPARWGFMTAIPDDTVMTSMHPAADGGIILRLYDASGRGRDRAVIRLTAPIEAAYEVNLMNDRTHAIAVADGAVALTLRPFEIRSFEVHARYHGPSTEASAAVQ
jgi:alpha-mannosidase